MSDKRHILSVILGIALLTTPVYAASQRRPQTPATRPPAPSFRSAPAPVFHPPHPPIAAAPARYHQPPPIAPRVAYNQPPIHTYAPPHPGLRPVLPVLAPPVARNQHIAPVKLPPFRLPSTYPANHAIPPAHGIPAPRPVAPFEGRTLTHYPGPYPGKTAPNFLWSDRGVYNQPPQPAVICDGDGDNCRAAAPVVCDGDGDNCSQVPYNYQSYGYTQPYQGYAQPYDQPSYGYQQPYYHPEPDGDDFNAYYLPYQAPPVVCDEDGDDCGPAPYFNETYRTWAPLPPIPVPLAADPAYYADRNIFRLRARLIAMDQAARGRYQTAVAHQEARQARHLFHVTRSLDGQLARLDTQGRRAGAMPGYSSIR